MKWRNNSCGSCEHSERYVGDERDWCKKHLPRISTTNHDNKCPHYKFTKAMTIEYSTKENSVIAILRRLWFVIKNPFTYILFGRITI